MSIYHPQSEFYLISNGVIQDAQDWNGGHGVAALYGGTVGSDITLQVSFDGGTSWGNAHMYGAPDGAHLVWSSSNGVDAKNFCLPACKMRAQVTASGMNLLVKSV